MGSRMEELNNIIGNGAISKNVYTVKINDSYKGEVKLGSTIEVKQLEGTINEKDYVLDDGVKFVNNKVMFLATYINSSKYLLNLIL